MRHSTTVSVNSLGVNKFTVGWMLGVALLVALVACAAVVGVLGYHAVAAGRASDSPTSAAVRAAFAEAAPGWRSHIDLPVHRLALTSAEEFGSGNYLFVFDVYSWFGIGSGYVTHGVGIACGGGGLVRDGGFAGIGENASDSGLRDTRAQCTRAYGPGRPVGPAP
jgi:hypothetical protein